MTAAIVSTDPNFASLFAGATALPPGYYYRLTQQGTYQYGPNINNIYSIGVVRTADGISIPGVDFYPDGSYDTTEDMVSAQANLAYAAWNVHYLMDNATKDAKALIGF